VLHINTSTYCFSSCAYRIEVSSLIAMATDLRNPQNILELIFNYFFFGIFLSKTANIESMRPGSV
jgi:formate-dependent nitrite reductase membrane component NrfD